MSEYWQLTVDILQNDSNPIVDKPKLQEKYLTKPPFRFLHDVITAVQKNTGFAPGLYSGEELDAKAIQDKDAKINYLQKIIDVVSQVLNEPVSAKPQKIVAGLEPESTNIFLQMLGNASKVSNGADAVAVQRVLGRGDAANPPPASRQPQQQQQQQPSQEPPPAPAASQRPSSRPSSNQQQRPDEDRGAKAAAPDAEPASSKPKRDKEKDAKSGSDSKSSKSKSRDQAPQEPAPQQPPSSKSRSKSDVPPSSPPPPSLPSDQGLNPAAESSPATDAMRQSLMRPQSARKAPPKAPSSNTPVPVTKAAAGDGRGSLLAVPQVAAKPVTVMTEGAGDDSDDDVEVVHEQLPAAGAAARLGAGQRGGVLVQDILEAEKGLKQAGEIASANAADDKAGTGIILKRLGKPAAAAAGALGTATAAGGGVRTTDTAALRDMVQQLCQSTHPLAKSMDSLQEDLENMAKEYRFWQNERRVFAERLAAEQRMAGMDNTAAGAAAQVADLDGQIKQAQERILGVKAQVLRNDETISKLLAMAVGR